MSAPILTFCTQRRGADVWLCTTDGKKEIPIALFMDEEAARSFSDVLALAKAAQHAAGQMGI